MKKRRYVFCGLLLAVIFFVYICRLGQWQLADGETYAAQAVVSTSFVKLTGTRGEILDRNGETMAGNTSVYHVRYNKLTWDEENRNQNLLDTVKLLESVHEDWIDPLPIEVIGGSYVFREDREKEIEYLKSADFLNMEADASAEACMNKLIRRYGVKQITDPGEIRRVVSVRYNLERNYFSRTNPCVLAEDLSEAAVSILSEHLEDLPGVEIHVTQERTYADGTLAPHILGTVGLISAEQYNAEKEAGNTYSSTNVSGYAYTDRYGQNGIENAYESVLRGKNGKNTIETDSTGEVLSTSITEMPRAGDTVWLTIDSDLQRAANAALAEQIGAKLTEDCVAGAAVALDVNTGGILACASYPNYDLNLYKSSNEYLLALYDDETQPLFNRALNGIFTPGSVFKPLVAVAALEEKVINSTSAPVLCDGAYHYYAPDYEPVCMGKHGETDVFGALKNSCNSFFFDVGRMLNIQRMRAYAEAFSLGEKTGCELPESVGIMSDPNTYSERHSGDPWFEGLTIQSAIGQCDDMFTPIELATYCSIIANGGTRYKTHFMEKVTDYDRTTVITQAEPEVIMETGVSKSTMRVVQEGMRQVCTEGTAASTFADFGIAVAGKTGTAETYAHSDNLTFIGYAPYDKPEIAVAVVVEYGGSGDAAKEVAKAMFEAYFFGDALPEETPDHAGTDVPEDTAGADSED